MTQSGHQGAAREKHEEARIDFEGPTPRILLAGFCANRHWVSQSTRAFI